MYFDDFGDGGFSRKIITEHEEKIIMFLMQGLDDNEIGDSLAVTEGTVKNYINNILKKTGFKNRKALVRGFYPDKFEKK